MYIIYYKYSGVNCESRGIALSREAKVLFCDLGNIRSIKIINKLYFVVIIRNFFRTVS